MTGLRCRVNLVRRNVIIILVLVADAPASYLD